MSSVFRRVPSALRLLSSRQNLRFVYVDADHHEADQDGKQAEEEQLRPRYPNHVPTTWRQKALLAIGSTLGGLLNPARGDFIAVSGETTGLYALKRIHQKMLSDPEGTEILTDKPRINTQYVDYDKLRGLPKNTLGSTYVAFLDRHNLDPDARLPVRFVDDPELAYVMQRYRDIHDTTHAVLGMNVKLLGEVAVKWVEGIQTGLPMCWGGALFAPLRFRPKTSLKYTSEVLPWALDTGFQGKFIMNAYFEKRWEQDVDEFRREFNIKPFSGTLNLK